MALSWTQLAARPEFSGIKARIDREVIPAFEALPRDDTPPGDTPKELAGVMGLGFGLFVVLFGICFLFLPDTWWGVTLRFLLFFPLFFGSIAVAVIARGRPLLALLLRARTRYVARSKALDVVARETGLSYVPRPGGEHPALEWLAKQAWLPRDLRDATRDLPQGSLTMAPAVEAARAARIMGRDPIVIGSAEQKAHAEANALAVLPVEDGFHGERGKISFDAFEWKEQVSDNPDIHHLIIVLKAPRPVQGITELRARRLPWLVFRDQAQLDAVDLGPRAFHDQYRLRSSDQVEARALFDPAVIERLLTLAHDGKFRAVARGEHLVFDIEGENRFSMIDVASGDWSDESLREGLTDLAETLDLVDALAGVFRVAH